MVYSRRARSRRDVVVRTRRIRRTAVPRGVRAAPVMSSLARAGAGYVADRAVQYVARRAYDAWKNRRGVSAKKRGAIPRGTYSGKFKKTRNWKTTKFSALGSTITLEHGSFRTDTQTVYVGHGLSWKYALNIMCTSIIKKLANLSGIFPASMSEKWQGQLITAHSAGDWAFRYIYKLSDTGVPGVYTQVFVADSTWQEIIDAFSSHLLTITDVEHQFMNFQIVNSNSCIAAIDASELYINMYYKSVLNVQNQTRGQTATDIQSTDVTNNPLQGMRYWGNGTGFNPRLRDNALNMLADNSMIVDKDNGCFFFDPNGTNVTPEMDNFLRRPPSKGGLVGCVRTARIMLNPGNIKKGILSRRVNMNINQYWRKILPAITGTVVRVKVWLGNVEMFAFEKMCRTGAGDQEIRVGFEVNQVYKASVYIKRKPAVPHHYVV